MIDRSMVEWHVQSFETGHCPFLSQAERLSEWIVGEIERWGNSEGNVDVDTS